MSISLSPEENSVTPEIRLGKSYFQSQQKASVPSIKPFPIFLGKAYYSEDSLIKEPMDFSGKNKFDLLDQHRMLLALFYPDQTNAKFHFDLRNEDLEFVKDYMSRLPRNAGYDEANHPDSYGKFLLFGDRKNRIPDELKIYNKIGGAYGFLIDNAFVEDQNKGLKFFLSAVIYTNVNQILNDNTYEYDTKALPFLGELGRYICEIQLGNR